MKRRRRRRPPVSSPSALLALLLLLLLLLLRLSPLLLLFQLFLLLRLCHHRLLMMLLLLLLDSRPPYCCCLLRNLGRQSPIGILLRLRNHQRRCFRRAPTPSPRLFPPVRHLSRVTQASGEGSGRSWLREMNTKEDKMPLLVVVSNRSICDVFFTLSPLLPLSPLSFCPPNRHQSPSSSRCPPPQSNREQPAPSGSASASPCSPSPLQELRLL